MLTSKANVLWNFVRHFKQAVQPAARLCLCAGGIYSRCFEAGVVNQVLPEPQGRVKSLLKTVGFRLCVARSFVANLSTPTIRNEFSQDLLYGPWHFTQLRQNLSSNQVCLGVGVSMEAKASGRLDVYTQGKQRGDC